MSTTTTTRTTQEIATRFNELAQKGLFFEIQEEFFADNVRSIDPENSPYFGYAEGKEDVRKKGESWVARITELHSLKVTEPLVNGNHFTVGWSADMTTKDHGRVKIDEIMLYEVKDGQIVLEQFFY